jgi:CheY-like chemotaxis protein
MKATLSAFRMRHFYEAGDGAAAMEKLDPGNVEIAFLDLKHGSMAHLGSIKLCREVRKRPESEIPHLPLIVVTAYSELRYPKQTVDAGADEFLAKPASAAAIASRINASSSTGVPSSSRQTFSVLIAGGDPTRNSKGRSGATTTPATSTYSSP